MNKEKTPQQKNSLYTSADFYMLRVPALPAELFLKLTAGDGEASISGSLAENDASYVSLMRNCYQQLRTLVSQSEIEHALAIASLSLQEGINRVEHGKVSKRAERVYSRLLRYIVRMCSRPTPFGMFAGIAIGHFEDQSRVQIAAPSIQRIRTRPDMHWLFEIIHQVEQIPEVVAQLHVVFNQTVHLAGGRAILPFADIYGQSDGRTLSLRATPTLQFVMKHANQPILYADLRAKLLEAFPRATPDQVEQLLWQLWENHFLLSDLRPPLTHEAPELYVLERLSTIAGAETIASGLQSVYEKARLHDQAGWQGSMPLLQEIIQEQKSLVPASEAQQLQLQVDASLHLNGSSLHKDVGTAAVQAAEILLRLTRFARGFPHIRAYLAAFVERYGMNQEVPLLDLLSPELGLDAPTGYQHPPRSYPLPGSEQTENTTEYDKLLHTLVIQAVNERKIEVELTNDFLRHLERWSPVPEEAPPSLELYLQLYATSQEDIDQGKWRAVVSPNYGSPAAGRSFGRFFDLMTSEQHAALQQCIQREEALYPDKIFAELSYMPNHARSANVSVRLGVRSYEIVVGITPSVPPDHVIPLEDLVVGVRANRFYIRSLRLGKEVIVSQSHMLNSLSAPNVCRFLLDCGANLFAYPTGFDWGAASSLPFLPRVVYKQIVLHPAQWHLSLETVIPTGFGSANLRWFTGLQWWRSMWRVPRYVYLTFADNRLLLDLEHPLMVDELYTEIAKGATVTLEELLPDFDHLWLQDDNCARYFSEIVVPLVRRQVPVEQTTARRLPERLLPPHIIPQKERRALPGDSTGWVYFNLYSAYQQHDELIAGPLRELVRTILGEELADRWFYIRYYDTSPHLRLRFHARNEQMVQKLLAAMLAWSRQQVQRGLASDFSIHSYEPEIERYGGPDAIEKMEQAFMADSVTASNLITASYHRHITVDPIALAIFSLDTFFADWGLSFTERLQWAQEYIPKEVNKAFHKQRQTFCDLIAPWEHTKDTALMSQREILCKLIGPQKLVLKATSAHIRSLAANDKLWIPESNILQSLAHMHVNRLRGIDRQAEQQIYNFWRQTLESLNLRPKAANLDIGSHQSQ
ncbi:MAG TPA: lantibiotic dehydratase [Ktedonobacteraceae bacterium]|nr:lantibiotic dehydratase [Ktedonobacteraceae bacterium]